MKWCFYQEIAYICTSSGHSVIQGFSAHIYAHLHVSYTKTEIKSNTLQQSRTISPLLCYGWKQVQSHSSPLGRKVRSSWIISNLYYVLNEYHISKPKPALRSVTQCRKLKVFSEQCEAAITILHPHALFRQTTSKQLDYLWAALKIHCL